MIGIINYGMGNISSIQNMIHILGYRAELIEDPNKIKNLEKIILPGVGSFDNAMKKLNNLGFTRTLKEMVIGKKVIILGICLGMQLLFESSEEGDLKGLSLIPGKVVKFKYSTNNSGLKIPHMGWNTVTPLRDSSLFKMSDEELRFYFVHSYHVQCENIDNILCMTNYGYDFPSAIQNENVFGVQFHPEKSHRFGMKILKRYLEASC